MTTDFVRVETQEQIDSLCAIAKTIWHETYDDLLPEGQVDYMIEKFQSDSAVKAQMAAQGYEYTLMVCDGADAGFIGVSPQYERDDELFLSKLYLLNQYRGNGVIRKAFARIEEQAGKLGLKRIRLTVNKGNAHAIEVYTHYGFVTTEEVQSDIGHGYVMDDYIMEKKLW